MQLHRFEDLIEFCDRAEPYLQQDEANHNLLLRLCKSFRGENPRLKPGYLAIVEIGEAPVAVAIHTPPYPLVISLVQDVSAIVLLAEDLKQTQPDLAAVNAPQAEADLFAEVWQQLTQQTHHLHMALRVHQLTRVNSVPQVGGQLRLATQSDLDLLIDWYIAFEQEALGEEAHRTDAESWATQKISSQTMYFWQAGDRPVSAASGYPASDRVATINFVYTPPQFRKQGFATACVAALSQHLLDQGYATCTLFTDLDNSTSNRIYRAIGYQPICDWHHYRFHNEK